MKRCLALAGFICLAFFWFWREAFCNYLFCFSDLTYYFYPYRHFMVVSLKQGIIPLWNPYIHLGYPFLATLQPGFFYPLSLIYFLLPFDRAFNWFLILHYPLGAFFMYLFCRELKLSRPAAVGGGLTFGFSGYLSSMLHMPTTLASVIWLPLVFIYFRRSLSFNKDRYWNVIITAIFLALMFLGGEPTVLFGTGWVLLAYIIYRRSLIKGALNLAGAGLLALALTAVQLLPFLELAWHSVRSTGISFTEASYFSVPLHRMIELVWPFFWNLTWFPWFDTGWIKLSYLGIIPIALALFALFLSPDRRIWWLLAAAMFILLLIGGANAPLPVYWLLYKFVPGFNLVRYPAKFVFILVFIIAWLAAKGIDLITAKIDRLKKAIWIAFIVLAVLAALFARLYYAPGLLFNFLQPWLAGFIASGQGSLIREITVPRDIMNFGILVLLLTLLFIWLEAGRRLKLKPALLASGLAGLVLLDLFTANADANFSLEAGKYHQVPQNIRRLMQDRSAFRYFVSPATHKLSYIDEARDYNNYGLALQSLRNRLTPNQNMLFGLAAVDGYESLCGADQKQLLGGILKLDTLAGCRVLDLINAKYMVSSWPFRQPGYRLISLNQETVRGGKIYLYENLNCLPRSFFVTKAKVITGRQKALDYILSRQFDPLKEVVLEEKVDSPGGYWFTSEWFYPGWKAFVDGRETRIYRANFMFRAVPLPPGKHTVKFVYDPPLFKLGALISLTTLFGLLAWLRLRR